MVNETGLSDLEIRAGTTEHHADLCELARHLNTVNLPDNPAAIRALLETSERSFSGELADPRTREYVFVLWDEAQRRAIGTSMIIAQLGRRGVPYIYLEVRREEKYSATLDRHFVHRVLTTRYSYDGPTEVGGLVMHPDARRSKLRLGSLISYVRFLFIAMRRRDFRDELLAELLPPFEPGGSSLLWEAYGRRFTGLSYREADQLSKSNKEFVSGLFPSEIYATLLSEEAQRVIGWVGPETRGVEKMLRRIGFRYAERVDPFDGGPHFTCPTDRVSLIQLAREREILAAESGEAGRLERALLARSFAGPPYFRALPVLLPAATRSRAPQPRSDRPGPDSGAVSNSEAGRSDSSPSEGGAETGEGQGGEEKPLLVSPNTVARLGFFDRGSAFWMPIP